MKTYLYRASNLKSIITFLAFNFSGSQFLAPVKNCDLFIIIIIIIIFFIRVFSECAEAINTLVTNFPEI